MTRAAFTGCARALGTPRHLEGEEIAPLRAEFEWDVQRATSLTTFGHGALQEFDGRVGWLVSGDGRAVIGRRLALPWSSRSTTPRGLSRRLSRREVVSAAAVALIRPGFTATGRSGVSDLGGASIAGPMQSVDGLLVIAVADLRATRRAHAVAVRLAGAAGTAGAAGVGLLAAPSRAALGLGLGESGAGVLHGLLLGGGDQQGVATSGHAKDTRRRRRDTVAHRTSRGQSSHAVLPEISFADPGRWWATPLTAPVMPGRSTGALEQLGPVSDAARCERRLTGALIGARSLGRGPDQRNQGQS